MKTFKRFLAEDQHYGSLINKDKYDSVDSADKELYKYTADGFTALDGVIEKLVKRYPYDGGTLYRGLHFDTQEQHDQLLEDLKAGTLKFGGPSSWTPDVKTAQDFAHSKKSYFPTYELMKASSEMQNSGDHMTGYGGIVLTTKVGKDMGCDVSKSDFAKESEVILKPGEYKVKAHELVAPFKRQYDTPEKVREILAKMKKAKTRTPELDKLAQYLNRSWVDKLEEDDMDILVKYNAGRFFLLSPSELRELAVTFEINDTFFRPNSHRLRMYVSVPVDYKTYQKCTDKMQATIDKKINVIIKALADAVKQIVKHEKVDELDEFDLHGVNFLSDYDSTAVQSAIKPLRQLLGNRYHQLNSREVSKSLKTSEDFSKHAEKIGNVVNAMSKL